MNITVHRISAPIFRNIQLLRFRPVSLLMLSSSQKTRSEIHFGRLSFRKSQAGLSGIFWRQFYRGFQKLQMHIQRVKRPYRPLRNQFLSHVSVKHSHHPSPERSILQWELVSFLAGTACGTTQRSRQRLPSPSPALCLHPYAIYGYPMPDSGALRGYSRRELTGIIASTQSASDWDAVLFLRNGGLIIML